MDFDFINAHFIEYQKRELKMHFVFNEYAFKKNNNRDSVSVAQEPAFT